MSTQVLDSTVAVLWGSETREVNWILLSPKDGRVSIARAHAGGFWVRDVPNVPDIVGISEKAGIAWQCLREGRELPGWATHRLAPPHMQIIEPIHPGTLL